MKRLGLIVPSSNSVMEVDAYRNLPSDVSLHVARMHLRDTTVTGEEEMLDTYLEQCIKDLATVRPHAVVFGCTSAGALRGNEYDALLCEKIGRGAGCIAVSTIASARECLTRAHVQRVAVITPYVEDLNRRIKASLEDDGLEVVVMAGLGIVDNFTIAAVTAGEIVAFASEAIGDQRPDGIFVSCTNFRGLEVRERIERETGLSTVTSNQAVLECALRALDRV